MIQLGKARK